MGLAAGVTPTQERHQGSEGVDGPEATKHLQQVLEAPMATYSPPMLGSGTGLRTLKEIGPIHAYPMPTPYCRNPASQ